MYLAGVAAVALLLVYEQSLVTAADLSQLKRAFDLNGYVGILYMIVTALAVLSGTLIGPEMTANVIPPDQSATSAPPPPSMLTDEGLRAKEPDRIAGMFDAIAPRYDLFEPRAERRVRPTLAGPRAAGARADQIRRPGGCLHRSTRMSRSQPPGCRERPGG